MTEKKPSYSALLRKIERLEAENQALKEWADKAFRLYGDNLAESVDRRMRAEQAIELLKGETA